MSHCYNPMLPQDKAYFLQNLGDLHRRVVQLELLRLPLLQEDNYVTSAVLSGNDLTFTFIRTPDITVTFPPEVDVAGMIAAALAADTNILANTAARHTHANQAVLDATTAPYTITRDAQLAQLLLDVALKADSSDLASYALLTDLIGFLTAADLAGYAQLTDLSAYALLTDSRFSDSREWTAATVSQADAEAGTSTTRFAWTPERVRQAILALAPSGGGGIPEAPINGSLYARRDGAWDLVPTGGTGTVDSIVAGTGMAVNNTDPANPVISFAVDMATQAELDAVQSAGIATAANKISLSEKAAANGVATLDAAGKIPAAQIPAVAMNNVYPVASEVDMLALSAVVGDVAIRSDLVKSFVLSALPASTLGNWLELLSPAGTVLSVAGQTGAVVLTSADVGLPNADNTSDLAKPISTATAAALAGKQPNLPNGTAVGQVLEWNGTNWVAGVDDAGSGGNASRLGVFPGVTENTTGTTRYFPAANTTITKFVAWCGSPAPSNTVVTLKKNGASIGTATIATGQTLSPDTALSVALLTTDYLTMDLTSTGALDVVGRIDF